MIYILHFYNPLGNTYSIVTIIIRNNTKKVKYKFKNIGIKGNV